MACVTEAETQRLPAPALQLDRTKPHHRSAAQLGACYVAHECSVEQCSPSATRIALVRQVRLPESSCMAWTDAESPLDHKHTIHEGREKAKDHMQTQGLTPFPASARGVCPCTPVSSRPCIL